MRASGPTRFITPAFAADSRSPASRHRGRPVDSDRSRTAHRRERLSRRKAAWFRNPGRLGRNAPDSAPASSSYGASIRAIPAQQRPPLQLPPTLKAISSATSFLSPAISPQLALATSDDHLGRTRITSILSAWRRRSSQSRTQRTAGFRENEPIKTIIAV